MKSRIARVLQLATLHASYALHRLRGASAPKITWLIGPFETAGMVRDIRNAVPGSYSALLARHSMYGDAYDWLPPIRAARIPLSESLRVTLRGPWLLGRLAARAQGVIYVGASGFLLSDSRDRTREFEFLKRHGKRIVCIFTGTDIRAPRLMKELEDELGEPNIATWLRAVAPGYESDEYDNAKRLLGRVAEDWSDLIITAKVDQRGYLSGRSKPFLYFFPPENVLDSFDKFDPSVRTVVVHAPSSPLIKGTQLVRAAVTQLQLEGHDFEYVELTGVTNDVVRLTLARAHIVLNEFYAYVPGVFAVEAMAACCAVLTRADEKVETQLPLGSNDAWLVTRHHEVLENLRLLVTHRSRARELAQAGRTWVLNHAVSSVTGPQLHAMLCEVLEGREP